MERHIKRIYIGLPDELRKRILLVGRKYRKNPLSHLPGGSDVVVEYHEGNVFGYDWIKFPSLYISSIFSKSITSQIENYEELSISVQMDIIKSKIRRIYARKYCDSVEYKNIPFAEIWNSLTSKELPWTVLESYNVIGNSHEQFLSEAEGLIPDPFASFEIDQEENYLNHHEAFKESMVSNIIDKQQSEQFSDPKDDKKVIRLSKAIKEFNLSLKHIVNFLSKKGLKIDSNPNIKLSLEAYQLLQNEFFLDKTAKAEAQRNDKNN